MASRRRNAMIESKTPRTQKIWHETLNWCNERDIAPDCQHAALANLAEDLETQLAEATQQRDELKTWFNESIQKIKQLESNTEILAMRLAACGVVALADTPESAKRARDMLPQFRSGSCDDVARRVDECMKLRSQLEKVTAERNLVIDERRKEALRANAAQEGLLLWKNCSQEAEQDLEICKTALLEIRNADWSTPTDRVKRTIDQALEKL